MKPSCGVRPARFALLFLIAAAGTASAQTNEAVLTPAARVELFDGRSLSGWTFVSKDPSADPAAIWSVRNGVIHCAGRPNGYARTVRSYRDYRLHAEWRWPEGHGNSGVFLHVTSPDKVWPLCLEAQLQSGSAGEIRVNGGALVHELTAENPKSVPRRTPGTEKALGEWNSYDILCRSNTVVVRVNGVLQNEITGSSVEAGAIGLQAEGKPVEFRNIYVEPLPAPGAAAR
jgi:3-keto-disaccharide hydrolase